MKYKIQFWSPSSIYPLSGSCVTPIKVPGNDRAFIKASNKYKAAGITCLFILGCALTLAGCGSSNSYQIGDTVQALSSVDTLPLTTNNQNAADRLLNINKNGSHTMIQVSQIK